MAEAVGVPPEAVMCACTHVHSGPPTLSADPNVRVELARAAALAAAEAAGQASVLRPAGLGVAGDRLPGVSRVRRVLRRDGTAIDR